MYVPPVWADVTDVKTRLEIFEYEISVIFASTVFAAAGAEFVSAMVKVSAPKL